MEQPHHPGARWGVGDASLRGGAVAGAANRLSVCLTLRRASQVDRSDAQLLPFMGGFEDGLDVRTTICFWHERRVAAALSEVLRHRRAAQVITRQAS
jgi:hypothetical protein